ncbi:MAG: hypothetical protein CMJ48_06555 [Planctomycetaceae bacterium]|nr:hypothetical protein [Planctomycetaceae bacterium]
MAADAGLPLPEAASAASSRKAANSPEPAISEAASISPADLRRRFLHHHEHVVGSALSTVSRYRAATQHLDDFSTKSGKHDISRLNVPKFVKYLRTIEVAPNGHPNTTKRKLRDKGIKFILETSRSMFRFGQQHGHLSRTLPNPFREFGLSKLAIRDSKAVFVFDPDQELAFFRNTDPWGFPIHIMLAKTGLRPGELTHTLIEDVDLTGGWLHVRSKSDLGWTTKTGRERQVPLVNELVTLLKRVIGQRRSGPLFVRARINSRSPPALAGHRAELTRIADTRLRTASETKAREISRREQDRILRTIWRDTGAVCVDRIRSSFIRIADRTGLHATCTKSWRHTFCTLLQEANVDPLVRQQTLGHAPTVPGTGALGMTGVYTHTTPDFQKREIERAVRLRPHSLELIDHSVANNPRD